MSEAIHISQRLVAWCLATACSLVATASGAASSVTEPVPSESLEWTVWPLPGAVNVRDGEPTDGIAMDMLRQLMAKLPQFEPRYRLGNRFRQQQDMRQGHSFCSAPLFRRADSDAYGYFVPLMATTPMQVVIRRTAAADFPIENGTLSLSRLAERGDLGGGYSGFRTYPPSITHWLEQARADGQMEKATGTPSGENLLRMVSLGRIDFTFEFPTLTSMTDKSLRSGDPLYSVPISGHHTLMEAGIYCSRTSWGRSVAAELDRAMRDLAEDPDSVLAFYRPWMPEETLREYLPELRAYYSKRAQTVTELD